MSPPPLEMPVSFPPPRCIGKHTKGGGGVRSVTPCNVRYHSPSALSCFSVTKSLPIPPPSPAFQFLPPPLPAVSHRCSIFLFFPLTPLPQDVLSVQNEVHTSWSVRRCSHTQLLLFPSFPTSLLPSFPPSLPASIPPFLSVWLFTFQVLSSAICWLPPLSFLPPTSNAPGSVCCTNEC